MLTSPMRRELPAAATMALQRRDRERGLSTGERKMLRSAKQILISEMVLSMEEEYHAIETQVNAAMSGGQAV